MAHCERQKLIHLLRFTFSLRKFLIATEICCIFQPHTYMKMCNSAAQIWIGSLAASNNNENSISFSRREWFAVGSKRIQRACQLSRSMWIFIRNDILNWIYCLKHTESTFSGSIVRSSKERICPERHTVMRAVCASNWMASIQTTLSFSVKIN